MYIYNMHIYIIYIYIFIITYIYICNSRPIQYQHKIGLPPFRVNMGLWFLTPSLAACSSCKASDQRPAWNEGPIIGGPYKFHSVESGDDHDIYIYIPSGYLT